MKKLTSNEVREIWLKFFEERGHLIMESSPLVPVNDPTLLWINAGVAPLKKYFDGSEIPPHKRMTNAQKCIRTNDIGNVGMTARHHTFFEMLGNFSVGDYFKKEAIHWGFDLLTNPKYYGFDLNNLYFTYYPDDLETKKLWMAEGVPEERLIPTMDCFWEIGEGPCGPCTEIHYDRGPSYDKRGIELIKDDIENNRYVEIWNIVFSSYNAKPGLDRKDYPELPSKNIDTGAGLERIVALFQDAPTNFETDLFMPIINHVEKLTKVKYEGQASFKIIADHVRTVVMALSDGATISNEGRGYVLRRLLRRALKHGRMLGLNEPFLYLLIDDVNKIMGDFYPEILKNYQVIKKIIKTEEEKFIQTLSEGEKIFNDLIKKGIEKIDGKTAFKLYDTYGFPIELTVEYANENKLEVDLKGFEEQLELQKERSRKARSEEGSMASQDEAFLNYKDKSEFVGYETLESKAKVIKVFPEGIILDKTPFYAESGGQVSDNGKINGIKVEDVKKLPNGQHLHIIDVSQFKKGDIVEAKVCKKCRKETIKNHSATHLLHQALKDELGDHVMQHGSRVSPESLRFDFNNFNPLTNENILNIEASVNREINKSLDVEAMEMPLVEAKNLGAMALFSEKYGDVVRVIQMGDYSLELCGGTHVSNTKDIQSFAIGDVESIGSGIYRIEAFTGSNLDKKIHKFLDPLINEIENLDEKLSKIQIKDLDFKLSKKPKITGSYQDIINYRNYLEQYKESLKEYEKKLANLKEQKALKGLDELVDKIDSKRAVIKLEDYDNKTLKAVTDDIFERKALETLFIINVSGDKGTYIAKSSLKNAGALIKYMCSLTNGRGGGRPDFAQGGTQDLSNLDQAIEKLKEKINE